MEDSHFVDSGIRQESDTAFTTVTGLDHLEGEDVAVLADGIDIGTKTVSSGSITLDTAANVAIVGLPYTYVLSPMRIDLTLADGITHGSIKRINELAISFYRTLDAQYGRSLTDLYNIEWEKEELVTTKTLFTGDVIVHFDGGFNTNDNIYISGSGCLPCTVRAIIPRVDKTGR
jgi:hypothetical protein